MSEFELAPASRELLVATIDRFVGPVESLVSVEDLPIDAGVSGAPLRRVRVHFRGPGGNVLSTRLVLKGCSPVERRVLERLQAVPRHVPFAWTAVPDDGTAVGLVCLQDLGETFRPDSLSPISPELQQREAAALADIHGANLGAADLGWLPKADRAYFDWAIESQFFRWAWRKAIAHPDFATTFATYIGRVEAAADSIVDEMTELSRETAWATLVHTDINPSNVLVLDDVPYIIDWDTARYGSLFLDLPHHLSTRAQAEDYRRALSERGLTISAADFDDAYRLAARYTGLRYLWWTLEAWMDDPGMENWVRHYLSMVV
jgi:hypothetical protein